MARARDAVAVVRGSAALPGVRVRVVARARRERGVTIKWRNGRPVVEVYDPTRKQKRHVKPRDHGMEPPPAGASEQTLRRWAEALERAALNARDARRPGQDEETCESFATRWPD